MRLTVARRAIELARNGSGEGAPRTHVGYYLVDRGEAALEKAFGFRPNARERILDWILAHPLTVYFGSIALILGGLLLVLLSAEWAAPPR